jgi:hypothetical protein
MRGKIIHAQVGFQFNNAPGQRFTSLAADN